MRLRAPTHELCTQWVEALSSRQPAGQEQQLARQRPPPPPPGPAAAWDAGPAGAPLGVTSSAQSLGVTGSAQPQQQQQQLAVVGGEPSRRRRLPSQGGGGRRAELQSELRSLEQQKQERSAAKKVQVSYG